MKQKPIYNTLAFSLRVDANDLQSARTQCEKHGIDFNEWIREKIRELKNEKHCPLCKQALTK